MWEQLSVTYEYGVDKLWVLNVGDLKPMEYPISLFMDMAWNPMRYTAESLLKHPRAFCTQLFWQKFKPMRLLVFSTFTLNITVGNGRNA